jgi:pimeloyl-ACP methyl ester carboxylesterase
VSGQPLHVDVHPGEGPPVLLIHGFLSSRAHWSANLDALTEVCTPVVVELLGHGRSPLPADPEAWMPASYVAYFEAIREQCGAERWPVIGHSLGGALALGYALGRPERVDGVVFTNSQSALASQSWRRAVLPELKEQAEQLRGPAGRRILERHPMHPRRSRRITPEIRDLLIADYEALTPEAVAATLEWTIPTSSVRDRFHLVSVPTLLTVGTDEEGFQGPAIFARETLPGLEIVELPAGHNVNLHDPDGWNAAVTGFLGRVMAAA